MHKEIVEQQMQVNLRKSVTAEDSSVVREIVASTGFFSPAEIAVAVELIDDRIARGDKSDYRFLFADQYGETLGYACYGPIACTMGSFDLYWIAVHQSARGRGIGRSLLVEAEKRIASEGGRRVYVETSSRELYVPTRSFYEKNGYERSASLADFYAPGDDKVIYVKRLDITPAPEVNLQG